jgi:hypothetical protein
MKSILFSTQSIIMGAIALVVFIAVLAFTFEPLATVVIRSRELPAGTVYQVRMPEREGATASAADTESLMSELGAFDPTDAATASFISELYGTFTGIRTLAIASDSGSRPVSLTLNVTHGDRESAQTALKRMVAHELPAEREITLPDDTKAVEIVADPDTVTLTYDKEGAEERWNVDGLKYTRAMRVAGETTSFTTATTPWQTASTYLVPASCRRTESGATIITYLGSSPKPISAVISGISAYIRDYSCFQSFSTSVDN